MTRSQAEQLANPVFLPDGRHYLFTADSGAAERVGVYLGVLGEPQTRRLLSVSTRTAYVTGRLLFIKERTLFAQPFDAQTFELSGEPEVVADRVRAFSGSATGTIVIRGPSQVAEQDTDALAWFDRSGRELSRIGGPGGTSPSLSPDGTRVAVHRTTNGNTDIWVVDLQRGTSTRFTAGPGPELHPLWSPDGSRIVFSQAVPPVALAVVGKPVGGGAEEVVFQLPGAVGRSDWSRDGRFLLAQAYSGRGLWAVPMDGRGEAFAWLSSESERDGQFSPDGRWVAYASNDTGRFETYLQSFPKPQGKIVVSTQGGFWPRWRADGKELFYVGLDNRIMAVPIQFSPTGEPTIGAPSALFTARFRTVLGVNPQQYEVSGDGQRFLIRVAVDEAPSPLTVILNWKGR